MVRTTFVEPFGVTTGSMADTIRGNRREKLCPKCGTPIAVGTDEKAVRGNPQSGVSCPHCGAGPFDLSGEAETFGDRLMVDKLVFQLRQPRRWEVAVFRCPEVEKDRPDHSAGVSAFEAKRPLDDEHKAYVKRVVGLPGERVRLWDGDVYANAEIQRKTLAQLREVRIPVFRMDRPPPEGWGSRWEAGPVVSSAGLPKPPKATVPAPVIRENALILDATAAPLALSYRHPADKLTDGITDQVGYNGSKPHSPNAVHDFAVECEVEATGGGTFAVRLTDGADAVTVTLPVGTPGGLMAHDGGEERAFTKPFALTPGKTHRIEFAFADRRAVLAIDGSEVIAPFDLPAVPAGKGSTDPAGKRPGTLRPLTLQCTGAAVVVRHFTLWRDIHYRGADAKHAGKGECQLAGDEYFMLGDNTANSFDSREWERPGVPERDFLGKPFLVHQPLKLDTWPWFGRVQAVDWERFRLLK